VDPSQKAQQSPRHHGATKGAAHVRRWLAAASVVAPTLLSAQRPTGSGDGFLFSPPVVSITVRGGYDYAMARSDIYSFTTTNLTLGRGDFAALGLNIDINVPLSPRTDLVLTGGMARRSSPSEFRKYIDNNDLPIEQRTELRRQPVAIGVRYALRPPGERVSALAWIPNRLTPWVGAGAGAMQWRFKQNGDWVNFQTFDVVRDEFKDSGWAPMGYANLAVDYSVSKHVVLTTDLRYTYARSALAGSFGGFDNIDLSGAAATMGFSFRY
jgi:hypothetical protein